MYKTKLILIAICLSLGFGIFAQGPVSPSSLGLELVVNSSYTEASSVGDLNSTYTAVSHHFVYDEDECYREVRFFDKATGANLANGIYSHDHRHSTKILFDPTNENVVYAVYTERHSDTDPPGFDFRTYLRRIEYLGPGSLSMSARKEVFYSNDNIFDFVIAPNGDVLIGAAQSDGSVRVNVYDSSLTLLASHLVGGVGVASFGGSKYGVSMDIKGYDFIIGHNVGPLAAPDVQIKKYTYNGPGITLVNDFYRVGQKLIHYQHATSSENAVAQNLALKPNGDILYLNNWDYAAGWQVVKLSGPSPIVSTHASGVGYAHMVVSENSKTVIAQDNGYDGVWQLDQYSATDAFQYTHYMADELSQPILAPGKGGFNHLSMNGCEILACGEDMNNLNDLYYELFSCDFCTENCCPEELEYEIDCNTGFIYLTNIPGNADVLNTAWYFVSDGVSETIVSEDYLISSVEFGEAGTYLVVISMEFPNGEFCHYKLSIRVDEGYCCEMIGPQANSSFPADVYETQTFEGFGTFPVPVICFKDRMILDLDAGPCEIDHHLLSIAHFDPFTWTIDSWFGTTGWVAGAPPATFDIYDELNGGAALPVGYYWLEYAVSAPWDFEYTIIQVKDCDAVDKRTRSANSTESAMQFDQVALYPNPAEDQVSLTFEELKTGQLELRTLDGKVLYEASFEDQLTVKMDLSTLPSGFYFVNITIGNQFISKKIIKQ